MPNSRRIERYDAARPVEHLIQRSSSLTLKEAVSGKTEDAHELGGYGAVWGSIDDRSDILAPGAFKKSLAEWASRGKKPRMLWQHDWTRPIGVWTLVEEDDRGLKVEGRFTKGVRDADEARALLKDGALDGLSIGFRTIVDSYDRENETRTIIECELLEVSIVTFPANSAANVLDVKSAKPVTIREFEAGLREKFGFSRAEAEAIAKSGFRIGDAADPRDEDGATKLLEKLRSLNARLTPA